ncbi:hypothetical protein QNI16_35935 [Cytophagaceae bacterium YF14B1]|uniref:Uncharacterized protein n=1 Tax=Xanthocytophaga flava TaxID=3048013 RepID=A0AAE3UCW6_9BACT|nr:hypothetical protein [Xanthocytophaga flavus]MDJ1485928.1 hypothetical protein [Xanthocytophaga flavus]
MQFQPDKAMKKLLVSALLLAALLFPVSQSQATGIPVTDIPRLIFEYIKTNVLMEKDKDVQKLKLQKLLETLQEVKKIRARQTEQLDIDVDLDKELWKVGEFNSLKLSDMDAIAQKVLLLTNALYAKELPTLTEYHLLKQAMPGLQTSNQLYAWLQGGTSAYAALQGTAPSSYRDHLAVISDQRVKQYALEADASQRMIHTAMTYQQLSGELTEQAMDLSDKVNRDGTWSMFGIGDIFSDLADDIQSIPGLNDLIEKAESKFESQTSEKTKEIKKELGIKDGSVWDKLFDKSKDISEKLQGMIKSKVESMDIVSSITSLFSGLVDSVSPVPEYSTRIEKQGMRMSTGERIQAQGAALDNLEKSFELQLQADQLLIQASEKSEATQRLDAAYQNALIRKTLTQIPVE